MRFVNIVLFTLSWFIMSAVYSNDDPFFMIGERTALSQGNRVWNNLNKKCGDIGEFAKIMKDSIYRVTSQKPKKNGYLDGYQSGLEKSLSETIAQCPDYDGLLNETLTSKEEHGREQRAVPRNGTQQAEPRRGESSFFNLGKNLGSVETVSAWQSFGEDCQHLNKFSKILEKARNHANKEFANVTDADDFKKGYQHGMDTVEKRIKAECTNPPKECNTAACSNSHFFMNGRQLGSAEAETIAANLTCEQMREKLPNLIDGLAEKLKNDFQQGKHGMNSEATGITDFVKGYVDGLGNRLMEFGGNCKPQLALEEPLEKLKATVISK